VQRRFVESTEFSAERLRLERAGELVIEDMVALEQTILADPHVGNVVRGTGGLRKLRLGQRAVGRGKRGGARVYYLDLPAKGVTHLLAIFGKREKDDLSLEERKSLATLVRTLKQESH
jgi:hypothetical protein